MQPGLAAYVSISEIRSWFYISYALLLESGS
jgi:hypothetical protein